MSLPQLSVRVAFASNPFDSSLTWTEIGPASGAGPGNAGWVRSITTKRGRERLLRTQASFQAGTATVKLDGRDRRFDPTNTSGPYYPNVQPEKVIQIGATWQSTFYPIWTGYVDDWPQTWAGGYSENEVPLAATDLFKAFAIERVLSAGYRQQVIADGACAYLRLADPVGATALADTTGNNHRFTVGNSAGDPAIPVLFGSMLGATPGALVNDPGTALALPAGYLVGRPIEGAAQSFAAADLIPTSAVAATKEFWVNGGAGGNNYSTLTWAHSGATFAVGIEWSSTTVSLFINAVATPVGTGSATLEDGNWHHVVITADTFAGTAQVFVDGTRIINAFALTFSAVTAGANATLCYEQVLNGSSGTLDVQEVAYYPAALTSTQVSNHFNLGAFRAQYTGQYVTQLMTWLGFPASRQSIDTGHTFCQADTQSEVLTKVLDFLQKLEQTEQGQCYVSAGGNLVFQDRYHRYKNPNATSQATIGDGGVSFPSEIPFRMGGLALSFDRMELFNDIPVTRRNGNTQEATNAASVTAYTNRACPGLSDLLMATDADALYCAQWILADTANPQFRISQLVIDPRTDDRWWPVILGLDIGAVVTVNKHNIPGTSLSLKCRIEGIEHEIDPPNGWTTTWHVSLVGTNPWCILDDPVMGQLDVGNRLGW